MEVESRLQRGRLVERGCYVVHTISSGARSLEQPPSNDRTTPRSLNGKITPRSRAAISRLCSKTAKMAKVTQPHLRRGADPDAVRDYQPKRPRGAERLDSSNR